MLTNIIDRIATINNLRHRVLLELVCEPNLT